MGGGVVFGPLCIAGKELNYLYLVTGHCEHIQPVYLYGGA